MGIVASFRRLSSAATVFFGHHGAVTHLAEDRAVSRQSLYREAQTVLDQVHGQTTALSVAQLQQRLQEQAERIVELERVLGQAVVVGPDEQAHFASRAQAEGVSLPVARRLLAVVLKKRTPSVAQLGRLTQEAGRHCTALLAVLDAFSRPRFEQAAADAIFFGKKPCLMVIEQHSLCGVSGRLAASRSGQEWAQEFRQLPPLRQTTQEGGSGLAKGLALVNQERQTSNQAAIAAQDDHFHVLREGTRVVRTMQGNVSKLMDQAERLEHKITSKAWHTGDGRGRGAVVQAWRRAERALDAWSAAEKTWLEVTEALRLFTPQGALNSGERTRRLLAAVVPRLSGAAWSKVRRALQRPQLLTYLGAAQQELAALSLPAELLTAAVRAEGLRRRPEQLRGQGESSGALRGVLLVTGLILSLSGAAGVQAVAGVRGVLRGVWRASSLVECINSVARMQQYERTHCN